MSVKREKRCIPDLKKKRKKNTEQVKNVTKKKRQKGMEKDEKKSKIVQRENIITLNNK